MNVTSTIDVGVDPMTAFTAFTTRSSNGGATVPSTRGTPRAASGADSSLASADGCSSCTRTTRSSWVG